MKTNVYLALSLGFFLIACSFTPKETIKEESTPNSISKGERDVLQLLSKNVKIIDFDAIDELPSYSEGFTISNSEDSLQMKMVTIAKDNDIKLFTYQYTPSDYSRFHDEYFTIKDTKVLIDSLLKEGHNHIIEKNPYIYWQEVNSFRYNEHNYVLLTGESRLSYMNGVVYSFLLVQFTDKHFDNVWLFYNGYDSKVVFNDFNGDDTLDYIDWGVNKETISLYSFKDNMLYKDSEHYVKVEPTPDQKEYWKQWGKNLDWYTVINAKESKWFYPLK